ncbi:hypothetical protein C7B77_24015 [Chamaesiphon polymorphus CCALA 037]|uniref:Flagellar protein FlbD n=1 Tax=Chamaesiphon polymorphus CCALA 037 TaxID=2107692 RepID=A0A2T1FSX1_9CYAN|nr:hypothetical protein C7B77_24015 [Chamaesiphon polymorphus CCALA 037]
MYIEIISVSSKRFINTDAIVSIDVGKAPPNSDILLTLSSGEVLIVNDETTKNKIIELLNST